MTDVQSELVSRPSQDCLIVIMSAGNALQHIKVAVKNWSRLTGENLET